MTSHSILPILLYACSTNILPLDLRAQTSCTASFTVPASSQSQTQIQMGYRLCITHDLWNRLLTEDATLPKCGLWSGTWQKTPYNETLFVAQKLIRQESVWGEHIFDAIERLRQRTLRRIQSHDPSGVISQLLLNLKPPDAAGDLLRRLGFVHLLTATGIHLYALAHLSSAAGLLILLSLGVPLRSSQQISGFVTSLFWLLGWLLAGARAGMIRPWIIVVFRTFAARLGFRWSRWSPLVLSLGIDSLFGLYCFSQGAPTAWAPGRWFYALAVAGGMMGLFAFKDSEPWKEHLAMAVGSWLTVMPVEIFEEHTTSFFTPVLSLVTIPLYSLFIFPSLLISTLFDFPFLLETASDLSNRFLFELIKAWAPLPPLWIIGPTPFVLSFCVVVLIWYFCPTKKSKILGLFIALFIFATSRITLPLFQPKAPSLSLHQLNVGQGDALLIKDSRSSRKCKMIDTGPDRSQKESHWLKIFAKANCFQLQTLALTHLDEDHAGAVQRLSLLIPIERVALSQAQWKTKKGQKLKATLTQNSIQTCVLDTSWESCWSWPTLSLSGRSNSLMNLFLIPLPDGGFYLSMGDLPSRDEPRAFRWLRLHLKVHLKNEANAERILKVAHHGSRGSTSPELLQLFRPTQAWISVGAHNRFGHPSVETLSRLTHLKIPISRTDRAPHSREGIFYPSFRILPIFTMSTLFGL